MRKFSVVAASTKLTDEMIKEEEKLHEASIADETETRRLVN